MAHEEATRDLTAECYAALAGEQATDTCCKCICILIRRMQRDDDNQPHEEHIIVLLTQLMAVTTTYSPYIINLVSYINNGDYAAALQIGHLMVQHETMLHDIAAGKAARLPTCLNWGRRPPSKNCPPAADISQDLFDELPAPKLSA